MTTRIAVLASGGGSNLQALVDHLARLGVERRGGEIVLVVSDRSRAGALERAKAAGIDGIHVDANSGGTLSDLLRARRVELIALAGYLRLVPPEVVRAYRGRMLNVHPALLPAFGGPGMYGSRVHAAVLASGARVSGPTVHFVDEQYDRGAIVAQWPVPVRADDTAETLALRVLRVEHLLFPRVVDAVAAGRIKLDDDGRVHGDLSLPGMEAFSFATVDAVERDLDDALMSATRRR
jgi:phosphoribosylglycinamide formyltransferase 1